MRKAQVLTPNDRPYDPPFSYDCTRGHAVAADRPFASCPVLVLGEACTGSLRRVGAGSGRGSNLAATA